MKIHLQTHAVASSTPYSGPSWTFDMLGWPLHWKRKAEELHRASAAIYQTVLDDHAANNGWAAALRQGTTLPQPPIPMTDVFVFLAALALENVLKGLYVHEHPECIDDGKLRGEVIKSHDLDEIARHLNITVNADEKLVLEYGSLAITSWGRYPVPVHKGDLKTQRTTGKDFAKIIYDDLFTRLLSQLAAKPFPK